MPNSALTLRILNELGPLAASSANRSGDESAQTVEEAVQAFGDDVQLYLDGGPTQGHVASTVVAADLMSATASSSCERVSSLSPSCARPCT